MDLQEKKTKIFIKFTQVARKIVFRELINYGYFNETGGGVYSKIILEKYLIFKKVLRIYNCLCSFAQILVFHNHISSHILIQI